MKSVPNYDSEIGLYLDPWYINGFFDSIYYFLEDDTIKFNKEHPEFVKDIKTTIDKYKEELLGYYKDAKPEEHGAIFKANEVAIMTKYSEVKGVCKMYLDEVLKSKEDEN